MLWSIPNGVGDRRIRDLLGTVIERQLRGEDGGLADRALSQDLASILRLSGPDVAHPDVVENEHGEARDLRAQPQVRAAQWWL